MEVNTSVKFYGAVSSGGKPASGSVKLQRKSSGGSWSTWKTVALNGAGKYSITIRMTSKGTWNFRTMMASDPGHTKTYSRVLQLKVH